MNKKVYLSSLLISCGVFGILSEGICASSEENEKLEGLLIRKKRIIESRLITIQDAPYVINVLANNINRCTASLLSSGFAITAAHCIEFPDATYSLLSGSTKSNGGTPHNITKRILHPNRRFNDDPYDLALVEFLPHINFDRSRNRPIKLYNGNLSPNSHGTISSWGCHKIRGEAKQYPCLLRSANVTIISLQECRRLYKNELFAITEHTICTASPNGRTRCDDGDSGAPLVVNGHLAGIMSWNLENHHSIPDVFVSMVHHVFRTWIAQHVPSALQHACWS